MPAAPRPRPLPPREAIAAFRARGFDLPESFSWQDLWQEQHAAAFTVAKSAGFDILKDLYEAMERAISEGQAYAQFAKAVTPTLQRKGWWGIQEMSDPQTGEIRDVQLGSPRRLRIIFDTNMRVSYAAGRWAAIERLKRARPFLRYVAVRDSRTRPQHLAWHDTVLPVDHAFWQTHAPPNGWRCRCTLQQLSQADLDRRGLEVKEPPPAPVRPWTNSRTGEISLVPTGIDAGWAYNPGKAAVERHAARLFADGLVGMPPRLAARASAASTGFLLRNLTADFQDWARRVQGDNRERPSFRVVGALTARTLDWLEDHDLAPSSGAIIVRGQDINHILRDAKTARPDAVPEARILALPELLARPQAILWDRGVGRRSPASLIIVLPGAEDTAEKVVVRLGQILPLRDRDGDRRRRRANRIATVSTVQSDALQDERSYVVIEGDI